MDVARYLERIAFRGDTAPAPANLAGLMKAHLLSVPFENLDIHRGVKIDLENLYDKIVVSGRGGFCYELNYLFYQLLTELGYRATLASGRVYNKETKAFGAEYDHLVLIVRLEGMDYLADVGFGEFIFSPMPIIPGAMHDDERGNFRIENHAAPYLAVKKEQHGAWDYEYIFSTVPRRITDFAGQCLYHQTSPDSHFTQKRLVSLATTDGRITMTGNELRIKKGMETTVQKIAGEEQFNQLIRKYFFQSF